MHATNTVVFLHGLGETAAAWDAQRAALPSRFDSLAIELFDNVNPEERYSFTLRSAAAAVVHEIDQRGAEKVHVCGLSLGAMVGLQFALDYPERVRSLTLAAGQVKPSRALMTAQKTVFRLLPASVFERQGVRKEVMLSALSAAAQADFSERLSSIAAPSLVLCGAKDRPNLPAARTLATGIPGAQLRIIQEAGHQSHVQRPEAFAAILGEFLTRPEVRAEE